MEVDPMNISDNEMEDEEEEDDDDDDEEDEESSNESMDEEESDDDDECEDGEEKIYLPGQPLKKGEDLDYDKSTYRMLHRAQTGAPCLSFDVIRDNLGTSRESYPLSMYLLAGTQAAKAHVNNILVMKITNLTGKNEDEIHSDNESSDSENDDDDREKYPKMKLALINHQGCVNRIRCTRMNQTTLAASWSELGRINIWDLNEQLRAVDDPQLLETYRKKYEKSENAIKPLFTFKGHLSEGYGLDWCPTKEGCLASGDCKGNIHIWNYGEGNEWHVDQRPYNSHAPHSVEDLQWSPSERNVLASCSVDKSIKIWDTRANPHSACMITAAEAHTADINVISWNRKECRFLVSGGDDGVVSVWDLRQFSSGKPTPVATFKHHTAPITTVEWHPEDASVFASGGADDQIAQWDLSLEVDNEQSQSSDSLNLPPQLLFIHQGQTDIKELHWHSQCPGTLISTAHSGFNIFRTISV